MAKRFHDSEIWSQDWFLELPSEYRLLWIWIKDKCDHAGVWKPNKRVFETIAEIKVDLDKGLNLLNSEKERICLTNKKNWLIVDFFVFQYGTTFNIRNKLHESIYKIYNQENISLRSIRGLIEVKWWSWSGQVEDFDTLKEKDKEKEIKEIKEGAETIKRNGRGTQDLKLTSLEQFKKESNQQK